MLVEGWLSRAAARRPERTAVQTPAGSVSYGELLARARLGAEHLAGLGVRSGERVAIALPPGLAFAEALHACLLLGAVVVPLDTRSSAAERAKLAEGAVMQIEQPLIAGGGLDRAALAASGDRREAHDLDATAVVIHTSGTTSLPRPVELSYGNILWSALGSAVALGVEGRERWLCALPMSHIGGLSILLRSAIYATTAVVHERFDAEQVLEELRGGEVTLVSLVSTTLARLLDSGLHSPPALRCALTGGGPVPEGLLRRAQSAGVPVSLTYGLTEACSQVTTAPIAALAGAHADLASVRAAGPGSPPLDGVPAGPPLFCTRVRIDGSADESPPGELREGEILVAGPTVARASVDVDGWLRTGDLGYFDAYGRLQVTGRKADTIVTGGENVGPAEVEAVLETHPDVLEAAAFGRADERWGEAVTAIVVVRPDRAIDGETLRAHCARALAPYKVPKRVVLATEPLPRTRSGKLLRRELR